MYTFRIMYCVSYDVFYGLCCVLYCVSVLYIVYNVSYIARGVEYIVPEARSL